MTQRIDGVRTISDLRDRCVIDDITGCWHFKGAKTGDTPHPSLWLPALRRRTTVGVAICVLVTGEAPAPGVFWHCTCETRGCANPSHRRPGTRSSQMKAAKLKPSPATRARIARGKRAASDLSEEAVATIRASTEPLRTISARYGISVSHASKIRRLEMRAPLLAPGASVFGLAGGRA